MDINKLFLANTIRSVESHNKREEEADCWRQHEMLYKSSELRQQRRRENDFHSMERRQSINSEDRLAEEREHWAHKKARVLSAAQQSDQIIQAFCAANLPSEMTDHKSSSGKKKDKKDKKKKDRKKDKKKKKKKKEDSENNS
eukprot:gene26043-34642_t